MKDKAVKEKRKKKSSLKRLRWGAVIPIAFMSAIGIILLALSEKALAVSMGVVFLVSGIFFLASAFFNGKAEIIQLFSGVLGIAFSIWLFVDYEHALLLLTYIFGGILLFRAFFGFWDSFTGQRTEGRWWKIQLVGVLLIAVFAIVLFFDLFKSVRTMQIVTGSVMLLCSGLELMSRLREVFFFKEKEDGQALPKKQKKNN